MKKPKDIISKISEIDYKTKTVHLENNYCCEYTISSQWEIENGLDNGDYRDWETDRKSTRLNSSHRSLSRMPSSA